MTGQDDISGEFILNLKAGQKKAFSELFDVYGVKIYHFAYAYLRNKPDAEELMQDVFLKIWENRDKLDPERNVKAYIFKIAMNCIYDFIRKKNIEKAFADFSKENFQPGADSLWHEVIWNDMLSKFNALVNKMPEQRRIIFRMSREEILPKAMHGNGLGIFSTTCPDSLPSSVQKNLYT